MSNHIKIPLTTASGILVADNQNSLTAGARGPVLLEDFHLLEKLAHFNRERIPERVVHAKGSGAYGLFIVTQDITHLTKARLFATIGKKTPVFARFSTVGGEKGSADTARDPRGFAIKFYTEEGNWDLVGNNTPVFFIRDPMKFPDFVHTQKRDPQTHLKSPTMMWDFWLHSPEALHQITILFSDRGIPDGYRHMDGFGSHTFSLVNADQQRVWVKWHFKTRQGIKNLSAVEASELAGTHPDYSQQDLFEAIQRQEYPRWRVCIQVMTETEAEQCAFNPFDLTKVWPHGDYPLIEVGELILNRNPENYFAEVEQAAFSPANIVSGMGFSPDKVLQGRIFSYPDAQRYRIGTNYQTLPVNQPQCPLHHYQRDGAMRFDDNGGMKVNYEPNSFDGPNENPDYRSPVQKISGDIDRYHHRKNNDDYTQAGNLFRLMNSEEQNRLIQNIVTSMKNIPQEFQIKQIRHFYNADKNYGLLVAEGLNISLENA